MSYSSNPVMDAREHNDKCERWSTAVDQARVYAKQLMLGGDVEVLADRLGEFTASMDDQRVPMLVPSPHLRGPMSLAGVFNVLLTATNTDQLAAAARELRARFLADPYTHSAIEDMAKRIAEGL